MSASSSVPAVDLCVSLGTTAQFLLLPQYDDLQMAVILPQLPLSLHPQASQTMD